MQRRGGSGVNASQPQGHDSGDVDGGDDGGEGGEGQLLARETRGPFTETLEETAHRLSGENADLRAENADLRAWLDEAQSRLDADMRGQDNAVEIHAPTPKVRARPAPPPETVC